MKPHSQGGRQRRVTGASPPAKIEQASCA